MKKIVILSILITALSATAETKYRYGVGVEIFYSSLAPYGEWVEAEFGYVWRPLYVRPGWRPYMYGRWVWTIYGWYWVSYEPFGWAVFHYGRWHYDDYYGWIWIPDHVWGPAWVEWRYNNRYIGWAPLPPYARFSITVGISYTRRWSAPVHYWNFVPTQYFSSTRVSDYVEPIERSRRYFGSTRSTVNIRGEESRVVNRGIDVEFIERHGNVRVNRVEIVDNDREQGERVLQERGRERVEVYRPRIEERSRDEQSRLFRLQRERTKTEKELKQQSPEENSKSLRRFDWDKLESQPRGRDAVREREMRRLQPDELLKRDKERQPTHPREFDRRSGREIQEQGKRDGSRFERQPSQRQREEPQPQRRSGEQRRKP